MTGVVQNQDSYMKGRIGQRAFYDRLAGELAEAFAEWARLTGRRYGADRTRTAVTTRRQIVVAMGTIADTATAVVDHLREQGRSVGCSGRDQLPALPRRGALGLPRASRARGSHRTDR